MPIFETIAIVALVLANVYISHRVNKLEDKIEDHKIEIKAPSVRQLSNLDSPIHTF